MLLKWKPALAAVAACMAASAAVPAAAQETRTAQEDLLDKIHIQDFLAEYFYNFHDKSQDFGEYFTEDAVFDGNGIVHEGREAIAELYNGMRDDESDISAQGTFHMVTSHPLIEVNGDTATATFIWTGIMNDTAKAPPRFIEQGREYDLLQKGDDGKWRFKKRVVISDSGLYDIFDDVYTPRRDFDVREDL